MFRAVSAFIHLHQKLLHTTATLFSPGLVQGRPRMSTPADRGISGNSRQSPLNKETVETFARNMADDIVRSLQVEIADFGGFRERQAQELASHVIEAALRDACRGQDEQKWRKDAEASRNATHPALSQSGLPILGSLDYPDAPPSTPLLPELEKSRKSFSRKLKGGLAKEFTPSPPPSTPRDNEEEEEERFEPEVQLVEHLTRSLSTEPAGTRGSGRIAEFAEVVSRGVMKCVRREVEERCSVELLAEQMAQAIVKCSIEEVRNV